MIFKKIHYLLDIFAAYQKFLDSRFNIKCVMVNGTYVVVEKNCTSCKHKNTSYKKDCQTPSSLGCEEFWEYKNGKN